MAKLSPSILSADFSKLGDEVKVVCDAGADYLHIDVMDGHFVPNISFGAIVMKSLDKVTKIPYDVHLMIEDPDKYIEEFVTENTEFITVHQEACKNLSETIAKIKAFGIKAGVSINPETPVEVLDEILPFVDLVLIMSVHPGFCGQKFMDEVVSKIKYLEKARHSRELSFSIEIDGGVNLNNVTTVIDAGADILVAGSSVFGAKDIEKRVKEFKKLI